jgi:hypothetical protein
VDGNTWRRGVRLSELVASGVFLAERAAEAIRSTHAQLQLQQEQQQQQQRGGIEQEQGSVVARGGKEEGGGENGMGGRIKAVTDEGVGEPVTAADEAANRILVGGYMRRFPGVDILTEEAYEIANNGGGGGGGRGDSVSSSSSSSTRKGGDGAGGGVEEGKRAREAEEDAMFSAMASSSSSSSTLPGGVVHLDHDPVYAVEDLLVLVNKIKMSTVLTISTYKRMEGLHPT